MCISKPAKQLPVKSMRTVEDLSEDALPTTYDEVDSSGLSAAKKFTQIGEDAAEKLIQGILTNVDFPDRNCIIFVDLNADVGDFLGGFISTRSKTSVPMYYVGICKDAIHQEWFEKTWAETVVKLMTDESLKVPGFVVKSRDPPESLLESPPPKPTLNLMVWLGDQEGKPGCPSGVSIPPDMIDKWYQHPVFGLVFRDFHDKVVATCGSPDSTAHVHSDHPLIQTSTQSQTHTSTYIQTRTCTHMHTHMHTHAHTRTHTRTHTHIDIHTTTHTHMSSIR